MKTSTRRTARAKKAPVSASIAAPDSTDEYLTTEEAAQRLKRSPKVLEYWRAINQGPPFYRQGRVVRYLLSEVMAWGATHRVANQDTAA
jgi:hypothetical protein